MGDFPRNGRILRVMHVIDSLSLGGAERIAVDLANLSSREGCEMHLCTTRKSGPLDQAVDNQVGRLRLQRSSRLDFAAIRDLADYIRTHEIDILHAHGTAVFGAAAGAWLAGRGRVIWHVHYGAFASEGKNGLPYRAVRRRIGHTFTASAPLQRWVNERLGFDARAVSYVPNFVLPREAHSEARDLPGERGMRIVCVANFTEAKDHLNLVRAMRVIVQRLPVAHLLLVGAEGDGRVASEVRRAIDLAGLTSAVSMLGQRTDVAAILSACDVGVISSSTEGLPLALLEYGQAGLAAVTTDVGQCADVVALGEAGMVVPRRDPQALGEAVASLLQSRDRRIALGGALQSRVRERFSPESAIPSIVGVYRDLV